MKMESQYQRRETRPWFEEGAIIQDNVLIVCNITLLYKCSYVWKHCNSKIKHYEKYKS